MRIEEFSDLLAGVYRDLVSLRDYVNMPSPMLSWDEKFERKAFLQKFRFVAPSVRRLTSERALQWHIRRQFANEAIATPDYTICWHDCALGYVTRTEKAVDDAVTDRLGFPLEPDSIDYDLLLRAFETDPPAHPDMMRNELLREAAKLPAGLEIANPVQTGSRRSRRDDTGLHGPLPFDDPQEATAAPVEPADSKATSVRNEQRSQPSPSANIVQTDISLNQPRNKAGEYHLKMLAILYGEKPFNHECLEWSQRQWADKIGCAPASVPNQPAWETIQNLKAASRHEREEMAQTYQMDNYA